MENVQLIKKRRQGGYKDIFPITFLNAIRDKESGVTLTEILQGFNMYFLSHTGSRESTRLQIPSFLRREGLWITYVLYDHTVITEWYNSEKIDDESWKSDSNWRVGSNALVGDISISSDGYWVINGIVSETKAQGEQGITPLLRIGDNNKLQVSYNEGKQWNDISDLIVPKFRWLQGEGTTAGTIQISMDLGKTWSNLSNPISNNLRIKKYIGINESLPTSGVEEGTIYMKGPYYAEGDTLNDNPIYRMWVYAWKDNTLAWQDNGEFTSISAGVVQETGNSETEVMSQKAVSKKLSELESESKAGILPLFSDTKSQVTKLVLPSSSLYSIMNYPFKKGRLYHIGVYSQYRFTTDNDLNLYATDDLSTSLGVVNLFFDRNFTDGFFNFSFIAKEDAACIGTWFNDTDNGKEIYCVIYEDKIEQELENKEQRITKLESELNGEDDFVYKLGNPFNSNHECIVDYEFRKNNTYIITISTNANISPLYSIMAKEGLVLLDENIKNIEQGITTTFAYKPLKDCIGIGSWVESSEYGKDVHISVKRINPDSPTYVIVDADICGDIDDLFAMRVLAQAEKQGKIVIVGINTCAKNEYTATGIDGFFCHEGINDICVGIDSEGDMSRSLFLDKCSQHYHTYESNNDCEDSVSFYKRALEFIPNGSKAILLTLGYFKSLRKVINDEELKTLLAKKINKVYCMGGNFVDSSYAEYNFQVNVSDTRTFINGCPIPIYFVGFETCGNVMGGKCLGEKGYTFDLMQAALQGFYREWGYTIETPMERNAPDAVASMMAVVDDATFYNCIAKRGIVNINDNGSCNFAQNSQNGSHYVIWVNNTSGYEYEQWKKTMEKKLDDIMLRTSEQYGGNIRRLQRVGSLIL